MVLEDNVVKFRRVDYPAETTRKKIYDIPELDNFLGDRLIRANRRFAESLDGVYRRGEIYLRWLQRLSSLFFGNPFGRALSLYVLLPLLGGFFIVAGVNILFEEAHSGLVDFRAGPEQHLRHAAIAVVDRPGERSRAIGLRDIYVRALAKQGLD